MDPQLISLYVTVVAALTGHMRPIWRYPVVFMVTTVTFLLGAMIIEWFASGRQKALNLIIWFLLPPGGALILAGVGVIGALFVWIAFLFNPSDEEAQKAAQPLHDKDQQQEKKA